MLLDLRRKVYSVRVNFFSTSCVCVCVCRNLWKWSKTKTVSLLGYVHKGPFFLASLFTELLHILCYHVFSRRLSSVQGPALINRLCRFMGHSGCFMCTDACIYFRKLHVRRWKCKKKCTGCYGYLFGHGTIIQALLSDAKVFCCFMAFVRYSRYNSRVFGASICLLINVLIPRGVCSST